MPSSAASAIPPAAISASSSNWLDRALSTSDSGQRDHQRAARSDAVHQRAQVVSADDRVGGEMAGAARRQCLDRRVDRDRRRLTTREANRSTRAHELHQRLRAAEASAPARIETKPSVAVVAADAEPGAGRPGPGPPDPPGPFWTGPPCPGGGALTTPARTKIGWATLRSELSSCPWSSDRVPA